MENLNIEPGIKTPFILFDASAGALTIKGKSIPENAIEFYQDVYAWLDTYVQTPVANTSITIALEYFNTSSSKCLLDIFRKLETLYKSGKSEVLVNWMYEEDDEDMMEAGDDYQTIVKIPFNITKL
ncbi:MAG: DUF1987 domain-containing protein [Bacteroidia bacterium]|nr:DUF1987 domain-containing protein [Bacteroidia bacterium]HQV01468.1 DUF1987 domain-containing protein [Bacteroidia bacterium]